MKCKCIKGSKWFQIDDSESSTNNGGPYEFIVGEIYDFFYDVVLVNAN